MKINLKTSLAAAYGLSLVAVTSAQLSLPQVPPSAGGNTGSNVGSSLRNVVLAFKDIATGVYSSLFVVALILFFVGLFQYLAPGKSGEDKTKGLKQIGFGILVMFVMVGIWGLVAFLSSNLGVGLGGDVPVPGVPSTVRTY